MFSFPTVKYFFFMSYYISQNFRTIFSNNGLNLGNTKTMDFAIKHA